LATVAMHMHCTNAHLRVFAMSVYQWFTAQKYYVQKTCFRENRKDTKITCPIMWTYNICAFDTALTVTISVKITIILTM